jgi:hypothetical protein
VVGLANGIGAALGAALAAFGLVSVAGIQGAILAVACLCAVTGAALVGGRTRAAALVAAVVAVAALVPGRLPQKMLLAVVGPRHQDLLFYEEARTATVSVIKNRING